MGKKKKLNIYGDNFDELQQDDYKDSYANDDLYDEYEENYRRKSNDDYSDYYDRQDYDLEDDLYPDEDDEEGKKILDESEYDEEELNELDEEFSDEFDLMPKKKKRGKKSKEDKVDRSGPAVKQRFFKIMEDYHSGDPDRREDAMAKAMKELEGFIVVIIKRSYSTYIKKYFFDLLQEGYLGVAVGMEKYDPNIATPSTFFFPYIKHEIQGFITRNVDRTTSHYSTNIRKINKVIEKFEEQGISYTNVDIAIQTGMTLETIEQSLNIRRNRDEVHIDACPPNVIDDKASSSRAPTPEQEFIEQESVDIIYRTINTLLTDEEAAVIMMHFGLGDAKQCSEGEIATSLGIPKDRVKRLFNKALKKLKTSELADFFGYKRPTIKEEDFLEEIVISTVPSEATESDLEFLSQIDSICD